MERSVDGSGRSRRDHSRSTGQEVDEDAIRAAITEQCIRKEPAAAVPLYSQQQWHENFERPWVLPNERYLRTSTEIEGGGGHIFCRVCVQPKKHGKLVAFKMHVAIEAKDPMGVCKHGIITLECHGCGFEQIVPRKPKIKNAIFDERSQFDVHKFEQLVQKQQREAAKQKALSGMYGVAQGIAPPVGNALSNLNAQHEFLNHIHELRQRGLIDENGFKEYIARYQDEARQRVDAMKFGVPSDPNKWPGV